MSANPNLARASRAERAAEAARLRAAGLNGIEIAGRMGISRSYAYELLEDPSGEEARGRKERYRGTCVDCGRPTTYMAGGPAERCKRCAAAKSGSERKVWTRERLITAIREWAAEHGEPPAICDWSTLALHKLGDQHRYERWRDGHATGQWPEANAVFREFGTWNTGIAAAGCEPRPAGRRRAAA